MIRPSASCVRPAQKMLAGAVVVPNVCVAGFHTSVGCGFCHPSHTRKFPLCIKTDWIATSGHVCNDDHCPWPGDDDTVGVTALDGTDSRLVPTAFVAVTVNV